MRTRQGSRGNARSRQECQREAARECGKQAVLKKVFFLSLKEKKIFKQLLKRQ